MSPSDSPYDYSYTSILLSCIARLENTNVAKLQLNHSVTPSRLVSDDLHLAPHFQAVFDDLVATYSENWMETSTGRLFHYLKPSPAEIIVDDISHHLSTLPRFCGAAKPAWSVAQHSIFMYALVNGLYIPTMNQESPSSPYFFSEDFRLVASLFALLHDAHEAYTNDFTTSLKQIFKFLLSPMQHNIQNVIHSYFKLPSFRSLFSSQPYYRHLHNLDIVCLRYEAQEFMYSRGRPWQCFQESFKHFDYAPHEEAKIIAFMYGLLNLTARDVDKLYRYLLIDTVVKFQEVLGRYSDTHDLPNFSSFFLSTRNFAVRFRLDGQWLSCEHYGEAKPE